MKGFGLYLFSQLECWNQAHLFPAAWALTTQIAQFFCLCLLLFVDISGIHQRNTKSGDNKIWKILCSRLSPLWLPCVPQLMGIPFPLHWASRPSLPQCFCPLRLGTEAQPLQFSAVCHISLFRSYHVLHCPLTGNLSEYFMFEGRGMEAWG